MIPDYFKGRKKSSVIVALLFIAAVFIVSAGVRYSQLERWKVNPSVYFVNGNAQMTTLDSYKWLRYADEYRKGEYYPADNDTLMYYPDVKPKSRLVPMLSWLLAKLSPFYGGNLHLTGTMIIPVLASLFVIPLGLYFFFAGFAPMGVAGGLSGSLAIVYLVRTAIGRVDTDAMNLFFPFFSSLFMLLCVNYIKNDRKFYLFSALTGFGMWLFYWWYAHPGITLVYLAVYIFAVLVSGAGVKKTAIGAAIFIVFANPLYVYFGLSNIADFASTYLHARETISAGFPNVYDTITEARKVGVAEALRNINPNTAVAGAGLLLFIVSGLINFRKMVPLLPVLALGFMVFKSSNRFGMFLAPFIGAGIAYGIHVIFRFADEKVKMKESIKEAAAVAAAFGFMLISYQGSIGFTPAPSIEAGVYKNFYTMKEKLPKDGVVISWWDYGLAVEDVTGMATFHDGMCQNTPKTYFIAKALSSQEPSDLYNTAAFLGRNGISGINRLLEEGKAPDDILEMIKDNDVPVPADKYYVLLTKDMIMKAGAISSIGNWDFHTKQSRPYNMFSLRCTEKKGDTIYCGDVVINTKMGFVNSDIPLVSHVVANSSGVISRTDYPFQSGYYLVEQISGPYTEFTLAEKKAYESNLFQMLVIGNADSSRFTEVINASPYMKVFEVNKR
jgi:dolichyl-diphosphooligosaccharide--protein glycosyltransferase